MTIPSVLMTVEIDGASALCKMSLIQSRQWKLLGPPNVARAEGSPSVPLCPSDSGYYRQC